MRTNNISILFVVFYLCSVSESFGQNKSRVPGDTNSRAFTTLTKPQSKEIPIQLKRGLVNTGLHFLSSQTVMIKAEGTLYWYGKTYNPQWHSTPDGDRCNFSNMPEPHLPCWSLIGRWGENGKAFLVGSNFSGAPDQECNLYLGVNDNNYVDNDGEWKATVYWDELLPEKTDDCPFIGHPQVGDVIIYWSGTTIMHSGYISTMDGRCKVTGINSYIIDVGEKTNIDPDSSILTSRFGSSWTVYHTNRIGKDPNNSRLINATKFLNIYDEGITDKYTVINFNPNYSFTKKLYNCHGYTFNNNEHAIVGYFWNDQISAHNNNAIADQGTAVEFILVDNGYTQIHAFNKEGIDHFNDNYSTEVIKLLLPLPNNNH